MKTILNLVLVAALAFGAVSCTKTDLNGGDDTSKNQLSFAFSGLKGGVTTYALGDVPASTIEKEVSTIDIYIFEAESAFGLGNGTFAHHKQFAAPFTEVSGKSILNMGNILDMSKEYVAYFVANNGSTNKFINVSSVPDEASIRDLATKAIASDVAKTEFLMTASINSAFKPTGSHAVELRRRVARFDVVNLNHKNFTITKLIIQDAKDQTNAFATAVTPVIPNVVQPTAETVFTWTDVKDASSTVIGKKSESQFYLNPTILFSETKIFIEATDGTDIKVFELKGTTLPAITANHRYKLTLDNEFKFSIAVAEWDTNNDEEVGLRPSGSSFGFVSAPVVAGGVFNGNVVVTPNTTPVTVTFDFKASSSEGTEYSIIPSAEPGFEIFDATKITVGVVAENVITYAAPYFKSSYTITLNQAINMNSSFSTAIRIKDKNSGTYEDLHIYYFSPAVIASGEYYPDTNLKGVKIGNIIFAPVNVGAVVANSSILDINLTGNHFQWGRNVPFSTFALPETVQGPLTQAEANATNKFILVDEFGPSGGNWMDEKLNNLWYTSTNNHPCPPGWVVPTSTAFLEINDQALAKGLKKGVNSMMIEGDDGQTLYLALAGSISLAKQWDLGVVGNYWTQQVALSTSNYCWFHQVSEHRGAMKYAGPRFAGYSLRCVKAA